MSDKKHQANEETSKPGSAEPLESAAQEIPVQADPSRQEEPTPASQGAAESKADPVPDKARQNWEKYLRISADFENFKKRVTRERAESAKYANTSLLLSLLPILDNLESAVSAADQSEEKSLQSLKKGVSMVSQQLKTMLKEAGLEEINAAGQAFDPNVHEAVSQMESAEVPEGNVLKQLRKGYKLHDRLLRPATVVVAKAAEEDGASASSSD